MEPSPTPTDKDPSKINTGLIIGLVLALTLLIILAIICILRRHRKGAPFFFGIKRKRSGISMSRGGSGVSSQGVGVGQGTDIGNIESGYGRISSEIEPDFVVPSEKPPGDEEGSAAAMRTAEAVTRGLVNARKSSAGTIPHPPPPHAASSSAADAGSGSKANIATTPVNIPEVPESQQPEVNHFEDGRGRNLMESRNGRRSVNAITAIPDRHTLHQTSTEPLVISSVKAPIAAAPVASKDSRLNRAVSATSSRDGIQSASSPTHPTQEQKQRHQFRRIGSCSSSRFLRDNFLFRSSSSSARTPRASSTSMRGFITTIRPEHHQQQIRQRELEQEFEIEDQLDQQTSLRDDGQSLLPGFDHRSGMGLISNKDAFTNPGPPPPLPVSAQARSLLNNVATRSVSARLKRGNTQPIHIRAQPQRHRTSSTAQEHALKSEAHNPGLYGYM
ncbi:hypothetical protein BGX27_001593 [Mortierella sp. AM989]|nr:hypothetical protein BGX27_001593 [Mortierella sp. AM989]